MSVKEMAMETISHLPEDVSWEVVKERIDFMAAIERGMQELDAGQGVPIEDVENDLREWLSK
ncbi:hypothetical protein [Cerasicoccus fimbriatus]|uniref:hypothetical protein n=1 Tax=Cerasicoccus fimbriatus TaxID=3014554 RepID=UPI0022B36510|nr:hypothetical protein [Cerasicoccus sp. TK19100]